jgi:proteasome accessory factor B
MTVPARRRTIAVPTPPRYREEEGAGPQAVIASVSVSRTRTERLVNLVICLLSTRRFLTASQVAATVPGYEHDPEDPKDHEAFQRKFERDKAELRELGVPLETGTSSILDAEPGYRIARRDYALPDIPLAPDEAAAVGIAARLWRDAGLAAAASSGLTKLRAAGVDVDPHATLGVEPVVRVDPAFEPLTGAVRDRCAVTFNYRTPEDDAAATRRLQPWGVVCWRGRWYVVGHDLDRRAERCFRLSRITGAVRRSGRPGAYAPPVDIDLISYVARWSGGPLERTGRATVLVRHGRAAGVRRWAEEVATGPDGDRVTLRYAEPEWVATMLVGYGADVVVLDPPEVRDAVVARLLEVVRTFQEPAAPPQQGRPASDVAGTPAGVG